MLQNFWIELELHSQQLFFVSWNLKEFNWEANCEKQIGKVVQLSS